MVKTVRLWRVFISQFGYSKISTDHNTRVLSQGLGWALNRCYEQEGITSNIILQYTQQKSAKWESVYAIRAVTE